MRTGKEHEPYVICVSEIMLNQDEIFRMPGYNITSKTRDSRGGGAGIFVRRDLEFDVLQADDIFTLCSNGGVDATAVRIKTSNSSTLLIVSLYSPPQGGGELSARGLWDDFFQYFSKYPEVLIMGDFNGHADLWSCDYSPVNASGREIESAAMGSGFVCLNNSKPTWCSSDASSRSILDLVFADENTATKFYFDVLDHNYGSDHFPITISSSNILLKRVSVRPTIITKKQTGNWLKGVWIRASMRWICVAGMAGRSIVILPNWSKIH